MRIDSRPACHGRHARGTRDPLGKVPCEVAHRAKRRGIPVIALAGTLGKGASETFEHGIDAFASIIRRPCTLKEAMAQASKLLTCAVDDALRMVLIGMELQAIRRIHDLTGQHS